MSARTSADRPPVTIAVVSWNTRELLARCLESMRPAAESGTAAVWVVDNASADGSAELVRESFGWADLIAAEENLGFGAAVNLVAARSESTWIAPANADVELTPGALEALLAAAAAHPRAGSLAPALIEPGGAVQHSVHAFPSLGLALAFNSGAAAVVPGLGDRLCLERRWDSRREREVDWAHGAFLLVRREAFDACGGFDREQWMYAEDLDLAWRLRRLGWTTRYVPAARVRHDAGAATSRAFADERTERHMGAAQSWIARRRGGAAARRWAAINAAGSAVRLAVLAPASRPGGQRLAARRDLEARYLRIYAAGVRDPEGTRAARGGDGSR